MYPGSTAPKKWRSIFPAAGSAFLMPPHSNYEGFGGKEPPERVNIHDGGQYIDDSRLPEWRREGISHFNLFTETGSFMAH